VAAALLWLGVGALTAFMVTRPTPREVRDRTEIAGLKAVELELRAEDDVRSVAWFVDSGQDRCALLLSGIHGSREASLPRARYWLDRGWSVLLPDLRGTGESDVRPISFGWNERLDVAAWIAAMRARGLRTIALHGQSLGAAAAVYAVHDGAEVELIVLDNCYDRVDTALARRLRFVPWPAIAFLPVGWFTRWRVGAAPASMNPVEKLTRIRTPTFMAVGSEDSTIGRAGAEALFQACAAASKRLHWVEGARHEELWLYDPTGLAQALDGFITAARIE